MRRTAAGLSTVLLLGVLGAAPPSGGAVAAPRMQESAAAPGSVVVGSTGTLGAGYSYCGSRTMYAPRASSTATYTVPGAGVLTSVSQDASQYGGAMRVVLYGPSDGSSYPIRGLSDLLVTKPGGLNTFPVRIPVTAGTSIGTWTQDDLTSCVKQTGNDSDGYAYRTVNDPTGTSSMVPIGNPSGQLINLSAVWEPDADADGYGDVSQDACPQSAQVQTPCPAPDTTLGKAPRLLSTKRAARVVFGSTIPGSTFTCAVDKRGPKPCVSPLRNRYSYGRHTIRITAISPLGVADPAPLEVRFKIRKKKR
jgi:hypothetical protein